MPAPPEEGIPMTAAPAQTRRRAAYVIVALTWMAIVFGSYFYANFDRVWSKVVELQDLLLR